MLNLSAFVAFHARQRPEALAIVYGSQRVSYAALQKRTEALSALLAARGVQAGQVVAAFMKNSAAFVELAIATSRIGAVFLPINFRLAREEVAYILDNAGARLLNHKAAALCDLGEAYGSAA
ncbi:MAG TPA: AMP-binding protein, partial [Roseomonas sp.]|nr:AMP-binding protein [Roseomonas sp.]